MTSINKYRIFCVTDNVFEEQWSATPITVCPTNGSHDVNTDSVVTVDGQSSTVISSFLNSATELSTTSEIYTSVSELIWPGSDSCGELTNVRVIYKTDASTTPTFRIVDLTNDDNVIIEFTLLENTELTISFQTSGITNVTSGSTLWELQIKRETGTGSVYCRGFSVYTTG